MEKRGITIYYKGINVKDCDEVLIGDWDMTQEPIIIPKVATEEDEPKESGE